MYEFSIRGSDENRKDLEWRCPLIISKNSNQRWIFRIPVTCNVGNMWAMPHSWTAVRIRRHQFYSFLNPFETWNSSKSYVKISSHLTVKILSKRRKACLLMLHQQHLFIVSTIQNTQIRCLEKCRYQLRPPPFTSWSFLRWSVNSLYFVESEGLFIYYQ